MLFFPLSKIQQTITEKLGSLLNIAYTDKSMALETIINSTIEELLKQKAFILCASNDKDRQDFSTRIDHIGLSQIMLSIKSDKLVTKEDILDLASKVHTTYPYLQTDTQGLGYKYLFDKVYGQLSKFSEPLLGDFDWYGLQERFLKSAHKDKLLQLHSLIDTKSFLFTEAEFYEMRTLIGQGSYLYDISFEQTHALSSLVSTRNNENYLDKVNELTYRLFGFIEELSSLRDDYYALLRDIEDGYVYTVNTWRSEKLDQLYLLRSKIAAFSEFKNEPKSRFQINLFSKADVQYKAFKKDITASFASFLSDLNISLEPDSLDNMISDRQDIFWHKIETEVEKKCTERMYQLETLIKSINKLNANNPQLSALEDHLTDFLDRINIASILQSKVEFNTLSFKKQMEFTASLVSQLENLILEIERSTNYFQWMSFIDAQHQNVSNVISALSKHKPSDWENIFEIFYIHEWLRKVANKDLPLSKENFDLVLEALTNFNQQKVTDILGQVDLHRATAAAELKRSNLELYKAIYKSSKWTVSITWGEMLVENSSYFSRIFPLITIDKDDFKLLKKETYHSINYLDVQQHNVEAFHHFGTIHTYIALDDVKKPFEGICLELSSFHDYLPIARWTLGNRSIYARMICAHLTSYADSLSVFHLKNITIISFGNNWVNESLLENFYNQGIKSIKSEKNDSANTLTDQLMNALCDESRQYLLLTQDLLLNKHKFEDFLYQRKLIETLEYTGMKLLDISSQSLIADAKQTMRAVFEQINSLNNHLPFHPHKQIQLEIN